MHNFLLQHIQQNITESENIKKKTGHKRNAIYQQPTWQVEQDMTDGTTYKVYNRLEYSEYLNEIY